MNCANHPESTATAFCQDCGKALCPLCTRTYGGLVLCEPCLLKRTAAAPPPAGAGAPQPNPGWTPVPPSAAAQTTWPVGPGVSASPVLAALLGFIPGVGAMYNGQFIKALLHVVIFIVLIGASQHFAMAGILIAAWVFYQVFDAAHTAAARRDGRPLPDPFGILDMSQRLGPQGAAHAAHWATPYTPPTTPPPAAAAVPPVEPWNPSWQEHAPNSPQGYARGTDGGWVAQPYVPVATPGATSGSVPAAGLARRGEPIGAIVLIVVGLLFLLSTQGWLNVDWIERGWPVLVLLLGVWLLMRRLGTPPPVPVMPTAAAPPAPPSPAPGNTGLQVHPLSITPREEARESRPSGAQASPEEDRQ